MPSTDRSGKRTDEEQLGGPINCPAVVHQLVDDSVDPQRSFQYFLAVLFIVCDVFNDLVDSAKGNTSVFEDMTV